MRFYMRRLAECEQLATLWKDMSLKGSALTNDAEDPTFSNPPTDSAAKLEKLDRAAKLHSLCYHSHFFKGTNIIVYLLCHPNILFSMV
jgi:hypothetical protein